MSRSFSEESQRLRHQLEAEPRSEAEMERGRWRLLAAIERRKQRRLWLLVPAVAALVALFLFFRPGDVPVEDGLFIASGAQCVKRSRSSLVVEPCEAEVELGIGLVARDLAFERGRARFVVRKRPVDRAPFSVAVSHGFIVVIGTRFVVEQRENAGRVEIEEGIVEFRWSDGSAPERLGAGQSLEWPRRKTPSRIETATVAPPPPPPPPPPERKITKTSTREVMRRLFQLKSQGRFDEAIELLSEASRRRDFTEAQRERLSFELGTVLRQSGRIEEACQHFRGHMRRFPSSPREKEIADTCP